MSNITKAAQLIIANKKLVFQNEEKEKRAAELIIANKKLVFQNEEKEKREAELIIAIKELAFQQKEKEKRAVALTASNDKLHETEIRLNKVNRLYSFLNHINKTILRVKDEQTLFNEVCRIAVEIGNFKMAWIGIADISRRKIQLVASNGSTEEDIKLLSDKTYHIEGLTDKILHGSEYYAIPNIQAEDIIRWQDYAAARGFISAVSLPIKKSGKVIGTFDMYSSKTNLFNDEEIKMLREVAEDISFGVDLFEKEKIHQDTEMLVLKNEKRFRSLIEHGVDMKTQTTREGKALYCSPSVEKSLGYSLEEFLHIYPLGLIHPDDIESYLQKRDALLKTPGKSFDFKQRRHHKNGNWIWCEGIVTNLLEEDGIHALVSNFRDITEKVISEKLHDFEKNNLDALINNTADLMWSVDRDFKIITANKGFDESVKFLSGNSIQPGNSVFSGGFTPEQLKKYKEIYERAFAGESFSEIEYGNNPVEFWLEISYNPIRKGNEVLGVACHSRDITNIKKAELELRKSEAFNSGVLNSLSSHIAVIDALGNIIAVNEAWQQFAMENGETTLQRTGVGSNYFEVCKKSVESGDEVASDALKGMMDVLKGKQNDFYLEYPCHSPNEQRWFGMRTRRFESDEMMVVVTHLSITERKLAENKLIITSNELQHALSDITKIMDSSLDVICAVDAKGNFLKVSAASEAVWGYKPEELIGKPLINFVYHEDNEKTLLTAANVMTGNSLNLFENRYVRKDGSLVPIEWSARWDKKDQIRYGIARDVTEKKRLEKAFEIERQRFFDLFSEAPSSMGVLSGPDHRFEIANPPYLQLIGKKDIIGKTVKDVLPEIVEQGFIELLDSVYQTGKTFSVNEMLIKLNMQDNGKLIDHYLNFMYQAHRSNDGKIDGILFFAVDVTEQVLLRKKIEESEARLKEAQALSHISNWGIDLATGVHTWSDEFYHICGMNPRVIEPSLEAFLSFVHPEDAANVQEEIQKTFETFAASQFYSRIITRDGITKYVYSEWKFELDENDKPIRLYGILQDITELTIAKEKLELTQFTFDHAGDAIFWMTSDARIVNVNEAASNSLGYTRQELLALSVPDIDPDFNFEVWSVFFLELREKHSISIETKHLRKDGSLLPVEIRSNYIKFGDKEFSCAFVRDISERKFAEAALIESENELRTLAESMPQIVWATTADGKNIYFNHQWMDYTGLTLEQSLGDGWLIPIHKDDKPIVWEAWNDAVANQVKYSVECRLRKHDGTYHWWLIRSVPKINEKGEILKRYGTCTDIDSSKQISEEIKKLNESLEQRVIERTAQLVTINKELEAFSYSVSHDLRAPLRHIDGFTNLLQKSLKNKLDEKEINYFTNILDSSMHMNQLIDDLLIYSRTGRAELKRTTINMKTLVDKVMQTFIFDIEEKNISISVDAMPDAYIDVFLMTQVWENLISNAIKFSSKTRNPKIHIGYDNDANGYPIYFIKDNGAGFDQRYVEKAFGVFQRLHSINEFPGTGIGLATAKSIILKHDGDIWAEGLIDKGASFFFKLSFN